MARVFRFTAVLLGLSALAQAQDQGVVGNWRTPGGAIVRIASCGPDVCATLVQSEPGASVTVDTQNPDPAQRARKLCGLQIGYGFHRTDPGHAEDGRLYDPKSGKTYRGSIATQGNELSLRGYVGIKVFGRTEIWTRTGESPKGCN